MTPPEPNGTLSELLPISEKVLVWVAGQRRLAAEMGPQLYDRDSLDDIRRIELMALAVREACFRNLLYPEPGETG